MAVQLADGFYLVRRRPHPAARDAHGIPIPGADDTVTDLVDGAAVEQPDGSWKLRLDPAVWPVHSGDTVGKPAEDLTWTVTGEPRLHMVPGVPDVDFIDVQAVAVPPEVDRGYPVPTA
ncbi:hypothetical protein OOJ91_33800 [Micromonospora lupini]|uniref:hypothetical protein n=1 Tax=Micromonospora lupini TaxID=285679 RepID=UPI0022501515|nr:hypothetical protein [Micromonospora lupini]MCX5070822.1 hypothetical protein [Micromonospora lupini]